MVTLHAKKKFFFLLSAHLIYIRFITIKFIDLFVTLSNHQCFFCCFINSCIGLNGQAITWIDNRHLHLMKFDHRSNFYRFIIIIIIVLLLLLNDLFLSISFLCFIHLFQSISEGSLNFLFLFFFSINNHTIIIKINIKWIRKFSCYNQIYTLKYRHMVSL